MVTLINRKLHVIIVMIGLKTSYFVCIGKNKKKNNMDDLEAELKKFEIKDEPEPEPVKPASKSKVSQIDLLIHTIHNYVITSKVTVCL